MRSAAAFACRCHRPLSDAAVRTADGGTADGARRPAAAPAEPTEGAEASEGAEAASHFWGYISSHHVTCHSDDDDNDEDDHHHCHHHCH